MSHAEPSIRSSWLTVIRVIITNIVRLILITSDGGGYGEQHTLLPLDMYRTDDG